MECITTASYSLVLNGETFGHFPGKKGLRQGDPLSPLLFTIAMEYLSRVLNFTTENMEFRYHSLCGKLKLHHLMFADDLLLFSRGDSQSIMLLLRSFASFSAASGLEMNRSKSNIYFNGVPKRVKDQIFARSGCVEGKLPFRYLGVPITAGKLGKRECLVLVEKNCREDRMFGSRHLSYLWKINFSSQARQSLGEMGASAILKRMSLDYIPSQCAVGYQWLRHKAPKVGWAKLVWCSWALPKHSFLNWLILKNALNTKDRLYKLGICPDDLCCVCGTAIRNYLTSFPAPLRDMLLLSELTLGFD
ncbi:uncharacterized protein LOC141619422 [Silene latifolia]|uniref:uncharacterized protein LOC141619422 n=1 Tax=Silene latifolia TaxID=37657 RepID=UPI003D76ACA2